MLASGFVILVATLYLGGLFLLAFWTDRRAERGAARFISSPVVYTLSLAVYCTSWTFYGAVGSAARNGLEYLTIYLGPTIALMGWWFLLRKLVRIAKAQRITSIADFLSARYGKSASISALVTLIAVVGITPYIALQLKAVAASFDALVAAPADGSGEAGHAAAGLLADTGLWVAVSMATFVILFGTRNTGADERHPGVVAAIAFESIIKLLSLAAIGVFTLYGLNDGVRDLFDGAMADPRTAHLFTFPEGFEGRWVATLFLAGAAMVCLPRQFQVAVVENVDPRHLATASWLFPLYLMLISLFVVPIAMAGLTGLAPGSNPDLYVLTVPLAAGQNGLALAAFIGGLSAATSMVIVASIALSIMISNHLVTPVLLRLPFFDDPSRGDFASILLTVRRFSIVAILTLGFLYYRLTASGDPLASIGLISFAGVAQFLPALVGAVTWPRGTSHGATAGLVIGFALWVYTLLVPSFAEAGWAFGGLVAEGPFGVAALRPDALFGLDQWDTLVHGLVWSLTANVLAYIVVSLATEASPLESLQSAVFINAFEPDEQRVEGALIRSATSRDLYRLTQRILGAERAYRLFQDYAERRGMARPKGPIRPADLPLPDAALIDHVERELAASVGAASARSLVSRIVKGETISLDAVIDILDETRRAIRTSQALERKSRELEETAAQLRAANEQLTRLDRLKDDFLSRVSHELRTPMTSIRSFSEILVEEGAADTAETRRFLEIIRQESERLTRLLDEILDLSRLEGGAVEWSLARVDAGRVVREAAETMRGLARRRGVAIDVEIDDTPVPVVTDADRLKQVFVNLLSNAIKYNDSEAPRAWVECGRATDDPGRVEFRVRDNGPGIPAAERDHIFSKFARGWAESPGRAPGAGLGLAISRQIVQQLGGELHLAETEGGGATFVVTLAAADAQVALAAGESGGGVLTEPGAAAARPD
ncbi:MAG: sensor histidine kinase [Azospirillaceae bacterium]